MSVVSELIKTTEGQDGKTKKNLDKERRCPNGTRKNTKTGECDVIRDVNLEAN